MDEDHKLGSRNHVLIWARPQRAGKGPAPSRTREEIAAVAVSLADADGADAVSMRKVAAALEIGAASLYGYVENKDELYDLMVDWVEGEDGPPPPLSGDWRTDLTGFAHKIRASILKHPWMASIAAARPSFGPNSMTWNEFGLAAMVDLDVGIDDMLIASEILQAFVRGFTSREVADEQALQRAGISSTDRARAVGGWVTSQLGTGNYPQFGRVVVEAALPHADRRHDALFTVALARVLDTLLPVPRDRPPPV